MHTTLVAVGRLRAGFRGLCDDYVRRLSRYAPFEERAIREAPSGRDTRTRTRLEAERLLGVVTPDTTVIALDRRGHQWSSEELAEALDGWRLEARPLALVIGGAFGLDAAVLDRARHRWSLGRMTIAHELARLVVVEQWYRAWTILRGEPYHK